MDIKEEIKRAYNTYAEKFEERSRTYVDKYLKDDIELFLKSLNGKRILDLGSGPGRDSLIFKQKGFYPVCIDISKEMVELCRKKGLEAYEMDMEDMTFKNEEFDGIWAYSSLLHLPKIKIGGMLNKIKGLLKDKGIFYIGMKEGTFEGFYENEAYPGTKVYQALYTKEELEELLSRFFMIMHFSRIETNDKRIYINFLCRKKV